MGPESLGIVWFGNLQFLKTWNDRPVDDLHNVSFFSVVKHSIRILGPELYHWRLAVLLLIPADKVWKIEIDLVTGAVCHKGNPVPVPDFASHRRNSDRNF